jgi:hypothetical protein
MKLGVKNIQCEYGKISFFLKKMFLGFEWWFWILISGPFSL